METVRSKEAAASVLCRAAAVKNRDFFTGINGISLCVPTEQERGKQTRK